MSNERENDNDDTVIDTDRRRETLQRLDGAMEDLYEAIEAVEPETDREWRLQLRRYHELGYLSNQYRKLKHDTDIDRMAEELHVLMEDPDAESGY